MVFDISQAVVLEHMQWENDMREDGRCVDEEWKDEEWRDRRKVSEEWEGGIRESE